jgi:hypothetical protein
MKTNKISSQEFMCDGPDRKIIITSGINKTLSYAGMVCRSEKNLYRFKEFLIQKNLNLLEFKSDSLQVGFFFGKGP